MIGRPVAPGAARIRVVRKFFAPLIAVPIFHAGESRPDGVDRVLRILMKVTELARKRRGAPARINDPAGARRARRRIDVRSHALSGCAVQINLPDFRRTPQIASSLHRQLEHMRVELCAVDLERGHARVVMWTDFDAVIEWLIRAIAKPEPQSLFRQLLVPDRKSTRLNSSHRT